MTERSLMIRCAAAGRYFAAGMDFPSARVFDVATSTLASVVEVPPRQRASLAVVSLTALSLGTVVTVPSKSTKSVTESFHVCYAAVGLSDGTVLLQNVTRDELVCHIAVAETQHAITSLAFCGSYLFCLSANRMLHVVDCLSGERVVCNLRVQHEAGAIAVAEEGNTASSKVPVNGATQVQPPPTNHTAEEIGTMQGFRIFVAGPTNATYALHLPCRSSGVTHSACRLDRLVSFASQASVSNFAWVSGAASDSRVAVTASAQEGVVRVWDARVTLDGSVTYARCRRTLMCGQRLLHVAVQDAMAGQSARIIATTFTGAVLVFDLGHTLLGAVADPLPTPPTLRLVSQDADGRLLFASVVASSRNEPDTPSGEKPKSERRKTTKKGDPSTSAEAETSILLLRGRFAVPRFEVLSLREATTRAKRAADDTAVYALPTASAMESGGGAGATREDAGMEVVDNAWSTHSQQQQRQLALATRAMRTSAEAFVPAIPFHARSVKELPHKNLTLEARMNQLSISSHQRKPSAGGHHALGLATVPLYQALHANDESAVMELLTVASRSADDVRATVLSLQLPYCLQLLQMLSKRMRGANTRSPLFEWVDAIIHYRGLEMLEVQQQLKKDSTSVPSSDTTRYNDNNNNNVGNDNPHPDGKAAVTNGLPSVPSPPRDFIAPLLHQYRGMTALYDSLATMYGRMSIFKGVRPSEKSLFVNSDTGILFPAMFTEIRCAGGEHRTLRVRSKVDPRLKKKSNTIKKKGALALLRTARRMAAAGGTTDKVSNPTSNEEEEELDLDALDRMKLDDEEEDSSDEEEEEVTSMNAARKKRTRAEADVIAESDRGSSFGVESASRSSEAEFDAASEDDVLSASDTDEEDEEDDDEEEDEDSDDDNAWEDAMEEENEENEEENDGMGEDMAELLAAHGEDERLEKRRHKRVRTDK